MGMKNSILGGALAAVMAVGVSAASPASATIFQFAMFDHLDGSEAATQDYGLRLDHLDMFFSAGTGVAGSTVTLTYDDAANTFSLAGSMRRNSDDTIWNLDYSMSGVTPSAVAGTGVDFGAFGPSSLVTDTLICASAACLNDTINLSRKAASNGLFFGLGAPTANDDDFGVVRGGVITAAGWVGPAGAPSDRGCCNDFLLAGARIPDVPLPAPFLMLGAAMLGLGALGRRRRGTA